MRFISGTLIIFLLLDSCCEGERSAGRLRRMGASGQDHAQNHCSHQLNADVDVDADVERHGGRRRRRTVWRSSSTSSRGDRGRLCFQRSSPAGESKELRLVSALPSVSLRYHDGQLLFCNLKLGADAGGSTFIYLFFIVSLFGTEKQIVRCSRIKDDRD